MSENRRTKLCKHCKTEMPVEAKICPNCKKKQNSIGKWIVIALVIFAIGGCASTSSKSTGQPSNNLQNPNDSSSSKNANVSSDAKQAEKEKAEQEKEKKAKEEKEKAEKAKEEKEKAEKEKAKKAKEEKKKAKKEKQNQKNVRKAFDSLLENPDFEGGIVSIEPRTIDGKVFSWSIIDVVVPDAWYYIEEYQKERYCTNVGDYIKSALVSCGIVENEGGCSVHFFDTAGVKVAKSKMFGGYKIKK